MSVSEDAAKALFGLKKRESQPAGCLVGLGPEPRDAAKFAPRVAKRILDRVRAQQTAMERIGHIQPVQCRKVH